MFKTIYLEIGNSCNLRCGFCPPVMRTKHHMTVSEFSQILKKIQPYTEQITLHLMGEPLVHPDFLGIVTICTENKVPVNLTTNGILLRSKHFRPILNSTIRQINFSLQSFSDNFPETKPEVYLKKILSFVSLAELERPDLYINLRLWDLNDAQQPMISEVQGMREHLESFFQIKIAELNINIRRRKGYKIRNRIYAHFDSRFEWPTLNHDSYGRQGRCYGLIDQLGILSDGTVVPCCLDKEGILSLGNIHAQELTSIVSSAKAERIRSGFLAGVLHEDLCQKCSYVRRFSR